MFRKLSVAILATGLAMPALADSYKVGVSAEPYPPFYTPDADGNWSGWEIDFMTALCAKIEAECIVTPIAWEGIIPALNSEKIDMIIGSMSITPARAEKINFSDKYYDTPTALLTAKGTSFENSPEGLKGAIVGVQSGSIQQVYAEKYFTETADSIRVYQTLDEELQDLGAGRIDAVIADSLAMEPFIKSDEGQACCEYKGAVEADPEVLGYGVGVGMRKADTELLAKVNTAIAEMRADGTYEALSAPYFTIDIYGN
ncbi:MAG: transporter substrate-binding domain-containing protein [Thalassovita sp.]